MKSVIYLCAGIGAFVGSYIPSLLGDNAGIFSFWSLLGSLIGGIIGVWAGYRLYNG
jgi:uncharacterized membrane protein YeaQ/YmgE (transglycosylase-associated protein family)